jgi:N-acyl-D-amino-acid deacylase
MASKMTRRDFVKTGTSAALGIVMGCSVRNRFDVIIKNGLVFDGSGAAGIITDLGIKGNKIVAIAKLGTSTADLVIDAKGLTVSPGFIDVHTHTDTGLLVNPTADSKIHQGVTTEVSGNCGYSPFPLNENDFSEFDKNLFEEYGIHVTWRDIAKFLKALETKTISINYATFTGHGNLRSCIVGKNDMAPSREQLETMKHVLAESMNNGSFGLSTGLEYAPGSYAKTDELIELCKVVSKMNGVYATHIRNEDDRVEEAIEEALQICREANVSTEISHF